MNESSTPSGDGSGPMMMSDCSRPITAPVVAATGGVGGLNDNLFFSTFGSHIAASTRGGEQRSSAVARATTAPVVGSHCSSSNSSRINGGGFGEVQNVRVVARVRPLSTKELSERNNSNSIIADVERTTIRVVGDSSCDTDVPSGNKRKFEFDAVFGPSSTQSQVYDGTCGDMISTSIFRGYNATILAYGQTGSGKTFTMGTDGSGGGGATAITESSGVIARAVHDLFQMKESLPNGAERVKVTMSYLEIYNEQAIDLLNDDPASANATLQVRDSKIDGVIIPNLKHFPVSCDVDVLALMEKAAMKRATGSTHMNSVSSRSHAICTLNVTIAPNDIVDETVEEENDNDGETSPRSATSLASGSNNQAMLKAKLTLVDLAGSERIKRTGAEGARMKEGININKGLFVLGQVVSALSELGQRNQALGSGQQQLHIPYRDSKLTRLLQDSLGGNSKTVMIACISPAESNIEESINTLRYAERTRNIKNSAKVNAVSESSSAGEAVALRKENQQLKLDLARMESRMMMSKSMRGMDGMSSRSGFLMGGLIAFGDMESSLQLQAQCSSLHAENELLKAQAQNHAEEILEASLRADRWQTKAEAITQLAQLHEIDISSVDQMASSTDNLINQLRNELAERKAELLEARMEAAVARATAGAIIASRGDLNNIVDIVVDGDDGLAPEEDSADSSQNLELTTELSAVSATIQQKEAMVLQMNKERACMDSIHPHYENLLTQLLTEVDLLTIERNDLLSKLSSDEMDTNATTYRRKGSDPPMTKRLREQIGKLETRIEELKLKTKEHERSMKMKDEAEKKCARLLDEITEDKRRRADLQRKLKEASVEMRAEKKAAQQKAAKFLKDSQRLKVELTKMKSVAEKQAAVLKRKLDQASAKEKARLDKERKLRSAENMRLASSLSGNADISEVRKVELSDWVDNEFEYSSIKSDVDDQRGRLESAMSDRSKLMASSDDVVCVEKLEEMDGTIRALRVTLQELEMTVKKAFPAAGESSTLSNFRFLDTDKFKGLSKHDAKFVLSYIFDKCLSVKQQLATALSNQETVHTTSIVSAMAKEQQTREKETTTMMMEHAAATLNLLQSTQEAVNSHIELSINSAGVGDELKEQLKGILGAYHDTWFSATEALKSNLIELKDTHNDHETMIDNLTKGIKIAPTKAKTKKRKSAERGYDSEAFESEVSFLEEGDGEDSEYEPTPAKSKKQKRRSPRFATKKAAAVPESPGSPIGATFVDDIDSMNVGTLKKACKKLGVPVAGKKADLMQRVRNHILSTGVAPINPPEEGNKKVNFAMDAELLKSTGDEKLDATECIKKNLWGELDVHVSDETSQSSATSSAQSKRGVSDEKENGTSSMTPGKKAKPLGFGSASPRKLSPNNNAGHLKQT